MSDLNLDGVEALVARFETDYGSGPLGSRTRNLLEVTRRLVAELRQRRRADRTLVLQMAATIARDPLRSPDALAIARAIIKQHDEET